MMNQFSAERGRTPAISVASPSLGVLRLRQVMTTVGLSRSTIYAEIKAGRFPKQVQLTSKRSVGWLADEVNAYLVDRVNASRTLVNGGV